MLTANVLSCHKNGDVMMMRMGIIFRVQLLLPSAEGRQGYVRVRSHVQVRSRADLFDEYKFYHDHFNVVADRWIHVQRRYLVVKRIHHIEPFEVITTVLGVVFDTNHIHNSKKVCLQVAAVVEVGHRLVGD